MKTSVTIDRVKMLSEAIAAIENSNLSRPAKDRGILPLRQALAREKQAAKFR